MKYAVNAYLNTRVEAMFDGYREGDALALSRVGVVTLEGETPEAAAEQVFAVLNADDRRNGKTERSLSVGDVVEIDHEGGYIWLACDQVGWKPIDEPAAEHLEGRT